MVDLLVERIAVLLTTAVDAAGSQVHRGSFYKYTPNEAICITFLVLFSVATLCHAGLAIRYRVWWMLGTAVMCGILEILGWGARLWSSHEAWNAKPYEMQYTPLRLTCTILGPTPLLAANFLIMEQVIVRLGEGYCRLRTKWFTIIFLSSDIASLIVQAVGGGTAAKALAMGKDPENGGHIMLGGIVLQMATITTYAIVASEFFVRYARDKPLSGRRNIRGNLARSLKLQNLGLLFSTVCMFIRAVYRTIELVDGWTGRIITTEVYFNVLDGAMITLAIFTSVFLHPGMLLRPENKGVIIEDVEMRYAASPNFHLD
ncbi:RTA1-like protein [Cylindrobasidium torrendii FP15055 ss-10]|uniref:RTA1-like protein n=1 Tax=Cylindrobasidium torrendii FP15055 ss-10 TaxID=1314674 RepID=A0A0D7AZD5_9AGAR|nr:RTA1-like protein [Cylindrobasidium torrendii FP15055 ss-10]